MINRHRLGDFAKVIDCEHKTAPASDHAFAYSIGTRAVRNGRISLDRAKPVSEETFNAWTRRAVPKSGDLIFSREAPMGEVGEVPSGAKVCLGQRTVLMQLDTSRIDCRFLKYALMAPASQAWIKSTASGSTVLHLNVADVRRIPLPDVPPLLEQRQIVEALEDHFSRLDAASASLATAKRRVTAWSTALADTTVWQRGWPLRPIGTLLREPMRNGRSDRAAQGNESGLRTVTLTAVTRNRFEEEFTKQTVTPAQQARGLWLEPGDIFVQRANTPELVGTAARFEGQPEWAIFPDLLIRLRANEQVIDSRFLVAALRSERAHRSLRSKAKGLAGSMPKIDQAAVASTLVPVPSLEDQCSVIERITTIENGALATLATVETQERRTLNLRRALLAAAFSGRLTGKSSDLDRVRELAGV
ncbi:hypothetical protein ETD83_10730 [Actinomadura soli]|uniref:Type I restriction modification DNA specificity domain-containing protein n=1 Tax=Actinomadura soli TaxID=2508997 RepID=A0A5C4JF06_9ACTN|nr:restriction endonuclease subunit S [Actinomadura soli]TMR03375.1 hypothetical protein ETD83_10730 [Actinomadura soli]